jgi:hypothetical protein
MNVTKTLDISGIRFTSSVFPTPEDRALWESLTPEQRLALVRQDEQGGFDSGVAERSSMAEILTEARRDPRV